jgi:hypothetical protein
MDGLRSGYFEFEFCKFNSESFLPTLIDKQGQIGQVLFGVTEWCAEQN